ncbi:MULTISPECIES: O-antigen ligase family protein [Micromonospora]|uniref:O-antigen ligase family protein n=1 Tax=Micromonospora TaxID=1873 RepID=UPI001EE7FBAF|nr:O-antigen ligase family protein [Micromonospora hortensis]MCG5448745.1 O-antigen ligase family protein [Micromonospora hortensis]WTI09361.1 O-antigen ligase family protein [Micromonospora sp. NBC_00821]
MTTLFGVLLSISGVMVAAWLIWTRRAVVAAFGDKGVAVALIAFAVLANAAPALAEDRSSLIIGLLLLGLLGWLVVARRGRLRGPVGVWQRISLAMAGAVLIWCLVVDALAGAGVYGSRLPAYGAAGLVLLAVWLMAARVTLSIGAMAYTGLAVLSVMTIPTALYDQAWRACTTGKLDKCSLAGALFKSFYNSENYVAMIASFTLVAAVYSLSRTRLLAAAGYCLLIIVATGSRTSYLAIAAVGVWVVGAWLLERRRAYPQINFALCVAVVVGCVGMATYLTWSASKTTLSNRGNIWVHARDYIANSEVTGVGVSKWYYLRDIGEAPYHFFHSGYVLVIFSGGLVALTLWGLWLTALLHGRVTDGRAFSAKAPVALFVIYSFTEVVWNPLSVDGLTWIFITMMLTTSTTAPAGPPPTEAPVETADRPEPLAALRRLSSDHRIGHATADARD